MALYIHTYIHTHTHVYIHNRIQRVKVPSRDDSLTPASLLAQVCIYVQLVERVRCYWVYLYVCTYFACTCVFACVYVFIYVCMYHAGAHLRVYTYIHIKRTHIHRKPFRKNESDNLPPLYIHTYIHTYIETCAKER